jgi:hypothetical protein|tara:strand:+ start:624 stop:806 length:183 start_codon:yes stop_codon:yes gene_type:complete
MNNKGRCIRVSFFVAKNAHLIVIDVIVFLHLLFFLTYLEYIKKNLPAFAKQVLNQSRGPL